MKSRVQQLRDLGFDLSEYLRSEGTWYVACSQCQALVINGHACHETGCSNQQRKRTV